MVGTITSSQGRLVGSRIAILMESDYVEPEIHYYQRRFAEEGAETLFLTRLWGQPSITFHGHEFQLPLTVDGDLEAVDQQELESFDALIVPAGMVSDRLRYTDDVTRHAPAVDLLEKAFSTPSVLKGVICHGLWLAAPIPQVVRGRRVTGHNNLLGDIANMGAEYVDEDVVVNDDLVTARSADHCHLFARTIIDLVEARRGGGPRAAADAGGHLVPQVDPDTGAVSLTLTPSRAPAPDSSPQDPSAPRSSAEGAPAPPATDGAPTAGEGDSPDAGYLVGTEARADQAYRATADAAPESRQPAEGDVGYRPDFSFSDLVAGYVTAYDKAARVVDLETSDGRPVRLTLDDQVAAEFVRNLSDPYIDASQHLDELLQPGRNLFAYGVFYPESHGYVIEIKRLVFLGRGIDDRSFETPGWWTKQLHQLARFYRKAQFGDEETPDYRKYRTNLRLGGDKRAGDDVQETDTISRLIYGMASAYLLTGEEDFLTVARVGADYLREHMRFVDRDEDVVYWYHGIVVRDGREHKLFTSEFGDDYNAIPMYEQIYALCGLTQLYRLTGDPDLASDIEGTLRLFRKFFRDEEHGGYFSHIDPITLSADHESLGPNRARKNWNSVGDHAPAYLINYFLATGEERHVDMLEETFDTILARFPHADDSPFVQERFHADWSLDQEWGWQQDRAVVGHNLKIAWNLMRMMSIRPKDEYQELAVDIARRLPDLGSDRQRGGWYDVVERQLGHGEQWHRFVWHDRKAWWQQEQSILAYAILTGHTGDEEFRKHFREVAGFYNAFFLDHEEGGVYFNVMANGTPYLMGNERLKGSHAMSMYHASELCYLATVYGNLLTREEPLTLWFRPEPNGFGDRVLRVAPDALPVGRVRLDWVEVDGQPYSAFDADNLTVKLPESSRPVVVKAHLTPVRS